jgi:lipoprotein-releasing system permease protein
LTLLFAWRYFKAKKSTNAINIIAWTSIAAIIFGTAALIVVLSVFNGFEGLVKSLYSSFYTDLKISPANGKTMLISPEQLARLKSIKGIRNFSRILEEKALVQNGEYQNLVYLKGVDDQYRYTTGVADHLLSGEYELGDSASPQLILGVGVEQSLGIVSERNLYDLKIYLPRKGNAEQINMLEDISSAGAKPSAGFLIQQDFDNKYGITNIEFIRAALKLGPDEYTGIEIALTDPGETASIKKQVKKLFGKDYLVQTKYEQNRSLYSVMNMERWAIYGIFCLIMIVAAFNMIGALTMLVLEKQKDISILHSLGASRSFIQRLFLTEGLLLALVGGGIGMLLALLIAWLQTTFHLVPLGGSFLISYFPIELKLADFLLIGGTVFVIALLASWLPARKAAAQQFSLRAE